MNGFEPYWGHKLVLSYDTISGRFREVNSEVVQIGFKLSQSCENPLCKFVPFDPDLYCSLYNKSIPILKEL
jgi:hypothetical protein